MAGTLYGVGIGPGDPELLTLKAVRIIRESQVIAVPGRDRKETVAYQIVSQAVEDLEKKEFLELDMPMTKDERQLQKSHDEAADRIAACLRQGQDVAFLTLGDPTVYATYLYVHKRLTAQGYETKIISGITSFCAAAARLNTGLVEQSQMLHIIPASYELEDALKLPGVKVLMKAGRQMGNVIQQLKKQDCTVDMIENCGMEGEKVYHGVEEIPEQAGYYSLLILKEQTQEE